MKTMKSKTRRNGGNGQARGPTWDIAQLYPEQGQWDGDEYLALPGNRLIEYSDGFLEFLPMPTSMHQWIVLFLWKSLEHFAGGWVGLGLALLAPLPIKLWAGKFREPDIAFMLTENKHRVLDEYWEGADLAMEIVSDDSEARKRDLVTKRGEYARARIGEYWIIEPKLKQITVLRLKGRAYEVHGVFKTGQKATSRLLPGFEVDVSAVFAGP